MIPIFSLHVVIQKNLMINLTSSSMSSKTNNNPVTGLFKTLQNLSNKARFHTLKNYQLQKLKQKKVQNSFQTTTNQFSTNFQRNMKIPITTNPLKFNSKNNQFLATFNHF